MKKLTLAGVDPHKPWVILHPGVSEQKRKFPEKGWVEIAQLNPGYQLIFTGTQEEHGLCQRIQEKCRSGSFNLAGFLSLHEFMLLIKKSSLVISVNTGTIHIAAALAIPVIVLYALTNPQHAPWRSYGKIFPFSIPENLHSKNEVIRFVGEKFDNSSVDITEVQQAITDLLSNPKNPAYIIPQLVGINSFAKQDV